MPSPSEPPSLRRLRPLLAGTAVVAVGAGAAILLAGLRDTAVHEVAGLGLFLLLLAALVVALRGPGVPRSVAAYLGVALGALVAMGALGGLLAVGTLPLGWSGVPLLPLALLVAALIVAYRELPEAGAGGPPVPP